MRASLFAIGLFLALMGGAFMLVDRAYLNIEEDGGIVGGIFNLDARGMLSGEGAQTVFEPPDWAAWSLLSAGAVSMLYAIALPKKKKKEG